ncbi:Do family serine endopeptidase [Labrys sp. (in: a-proteobacteria)]|uniref:Do family serine endopeptidase n=1 Tax=Labrys sp. (in: a-proteobacteria) TaxID=1917972 RepID=UPI0039E6E8B0
MPIQLNTLMRRSGAVAIAALLAASPVTLVAPPAMAAAGPPSVADLSAELIDAVVNISTSQTVAAGSNDDDDEDAPKQPMPKLPPGSPFEEFFNQFFNNKDGKGLQRPRKTEALGSGFVIDPSGIIVTNNHVIDDADDIEVNFNDGSKLKAKLLGRDKKVDVAVLKVDPPKPLKAVKFADSDKVRVGDWAMAIGNPFGLSSTVTLGIISARNRDINSGPYDNYLQTDAAINKGNSGGPLFDMDGGVIGINTAIISPTGGSIGLGFSMPSATVQPVIEQLRLYGETRRGWLGVRIQGVSDDIAESLGMQKAQGALIAGVDDKGPAKPAGLEPGDVILKFDGHDIKEMRDLPRLVADTPVDKKVEVVILRKGQTLTKTVTVARLDESDGAIKASTRGTETPEKPKITKALGLEMSGITKELRDKYKLANDAKGVVVTKVDNGSSAEDKQVKVGDVILQVGQQAVSNPEDVSKRIEELKKSGTKQALLLLSNTQGELRFVALALN